MTYQGRNTKTKKTLKKKKLCSKLTFVLICLRGYATRWTAIHDVSWKKSTGRSTIYILRVFCGSPKRFQEIHFLFASKLPLYAKGKWKGCWNLHHLGCFCRTVVRYLVPVERDGRQPDEKFHQCSVGRYRGNACCSPCLPSAAAPFDLTATRAAVCGSAVSGVVLLQRFQTISTTYAAGVTYLCDPLR